MEDTVRVAVNIRPLITPELLNGCTNCISVAPNEPQVHIGSHTFTYDFVFGSGGYPSLEIYDHCVAPLVDALFNGYNATVLAYGQTGSGKTYTMGTNYGGDRADGGIIPRVMEDIFRKAEATKDSTELLIRVSFIEIFKEDVFDLLDSNSPPLLRNDGGVHPKNVALSRAPIQIRETASGGITLAGVTEVKVKTKEEMGSYLTKGSLCRATGCTNMNSQSSRSHAIFTITLEQKKVSSSLGTTEVGGEDILCAKLHLVDLAGSERAKRTGADGMRLKEGIHINKGLLALGNVISALGDERKRKEGGHVPYRDSKLTRLLQDSLGGNSKTVMIACVSPADTNAEETLNTLKYANRARNIQNKAVINRDPGAAQMQKMRSQIEQLQTELLFYRGDSASFDELQMLKHKISLLEASNRELQSELKERRVTCEHFSKRAYDFQVEKDKLILTIESVRNGNSLDEIESSQNEVQLQQKIKQESEQFRPWKASREKEVMQLKKEERRNKYEMHKLVALNQKQKLLLQRKTEEASQATKRLKELLETRKASSRETLSGAGVNGPGTQGLMQAIEHEIEVTVLVHEVKRQTEERARMAKEVARLREENELLKNAKIRTSFSLHQVKAHASALEKRAAKVLVLEDMDTSDSEESEDDPDLDDEWKPEQESDLDSEQESVIKQNRNPCCTCSRRSSCKTMKCHPQEFDEEVKEQQVLPSRGALLLRTALADKSVEESKDKEGAKRRRKPLSDIGNTTVNIYRVSSQ